MKKHAVIREAVSFVAGLLVGLSIVLAVFAMMVGDSVHWPALWLLPPLVALAFGLALQFVVVVARGGSRQRWSVTRRLAE
jgi:formate/nitrite transporter FocA (FNT family)